MHGVLNVVQDPPPTVCDRYAVDRRSGSKCTARSDPRFYVVVCVVFVFLVIRRSAAYCGIPPLYGGEMAIVLFALLCVRRGSIAQFTGNPVGCLSLVFVGLSIPFILIGYRDVGTQSIMYGSVIYYAIFMFFGYATVYTRADQRNFLRLLYYALLLSNCHLLVTRFLPLRAMSPLINGVPLLGNHDSAYVYFSLGIAYAILYGLDMGRLKSIPLLFLSLAAYVLGGERGSMLGVIAVGILLLWYRRVWWRPATGRLIQIAVVAVPLATLCIITGAPKSPIGQAVLGQVHLFQSIAGESPDLETKSATKSHRLHMWTQVIDETVRTDPWFGQGFREPLVEEVFRHPHCSFVTIFGRMGLTGLFPATILYVLFPLFIALRLKSSCPHLGEVDLLFYLCLAVSFWGAMFFGPTLESPYSSLVCNFAYGAFLRAAELSGCLRNSRAMYIA